MHMDVENSLTAARITVHHCAVTGLSNPLLFCNLSGSKRELPGKLGIILA